MIRPYGDAAWLYRRAGWVGVIPVGYRPRRKNPPMKGYTGWAGADPSGPDIQTWVDGKEASWNIGLHLPPGIIVPDVDAYNGGDEALRRLEETVGHPLPPTWSSTARGEHSPSRHRFYRADLPPGRVWRDHPAGDRAGIDALHVGHRYAVVWPSIHPDGPQYGWYDPDGEFWEGVPEPGWMTALDDAWITALSKPGEPLPGTAADDATTMEALARLRPTTGDGGTRTGQPCRIVSKIFRAEMARIDGAKDRQSAGGLHNPGQLYALVALGMEGHAGVRQALSQHQAAYVQARMVYRGESEASADADWWRMCRGAVGKWAAASGTAVAVCDCDGPPPDPRPAPAVTAPDTSGQTSTTATATRPHPADGNGPADPEGVDWAGWETAEPDAQAVEVHGGPAPADGADDAFWTARKILWHIHQSAVAGYASPWATLGVVLARVLAATPPVVQLPNTVGGYGSLNLFTAIVGPSGAGKGAAERVARLCVEIDPRRSGSMTDFPTYTLGSGEGLAHMFMKRAKVSKADPDPEPYQYNTAALVSVPEIDTLAALQNRQGSTLGGQLRQAAMGEQLGFFYVDKDKRMMVPEHAYRLCLSAGVQPKRAAALLSEADGGTPQRFVWLPATFGEGELPAADDMPEAPEPVLWLAPQWPVAQPCPGGVRTVIPLPDAAVARTVELRREHAQGLGDPLDGHANLVRLKVAAALAILDGRAEVDDEDWALSGVVMGVSARTRQHILDELAAEKREANRATAEAEAHRQIIVTDRVDQRRHQQAATTIKNRLARVTDGDGWLGHGDTRRAAGRYRDVFEAVMDGLVSTGAVEVREAENRGQRVVMYRLARRE